MLWVSFFFLWCLFVIYEEDLKIVVKAISSLLVCIASIGLIFHSRLHCHESAKKRAGQPIKWRSEVEQIGKLLFMELLKSSGFNYLLLNYSLVKCVAEIKSLPKFQPLCPSTSVCESSPCAFWDKSGLFLLEELVHSERLVPAQIRQVVLYDVLAGPVEVCVTTGQLSLPCLHWQFTVNWNILVKRL